MKYTAFFVLGLIIFITPSLGITTEWKLIITRVCGAIIMLGIILRHYYMDSLRYENQTFDEDLPEEDESEGEGESESEEESEIGHIELVSLEDPEEGDEYDDFTEDLSEEMEEFLGEDGNEEEVEDDEMSTLEDRSV